MATDKTTNSDPARETFRAMLRTFGLVRQVMDAHFAQFGISGAQWGVLRTLHRARAQGRPELRATDVSEQLLVRPPSVTAVIDRLVRAGLVDRIASTVDMRAKLLRLTPRGEELIQRGLKAHESQIRKVMGGLTRRQQQQMAALLDGMETHLRTLLNSHGSPA